MTLLALSGEDRDHACARGPCPHCGGSGLLRVDDQRYRTCLDCLGQGRSLPLASDGLFFRIVSVASASAAR